MNVMIDTNIIISAALNTELTDEERRELEAAESRHPVFDEDSPAMSAEQLMQLKRVNHQSRTKKTVAIRLSPATLQKAKQYGKGYTGFLSRLLDAAINDEELVRRSI